MKRLPFVLYVIGTLLLVSPLLSGANIIPVPIYVSYVGIGVIVISVFAMHTLTRESTPRNQSGEERE